VACTTIMDPGDGLVTIVESGNHTGGLPGAFDLLYARVWEEPKTSVFRKAENEVTVRIKLH